MSLTDFCKIELENRKMNNRKFGCHLAADALCRARYSDLDFRILARARSEQHLKVLEALYIQSLKPILCRQKQFVTDLKLFRRPST